MFVHEGSDDFEADGGGLGLLNPSHGFNIFSFHNWLQLLGLDQVELGLVVADRWDLVQVEHGFVTRVE